MLRTFDDIGAHTRPVLVDLWLTPPTGDLLRQVEGDKVARAWFIAQGALSATAAGYPMMSRLVNYLPSVRDNVTRR